MPEANLNAKRLARLALIACVAGMMAGCGWTARDEFYHNRSMALAPQAGDGSQITATQRGPGIPDLASPQVVQGAAGREREEETQ